MKSWECVSVSKGTLVEPGGKCPENPFCIRVVPGQYVGLSFPLQAHGTSQLAL